jgi:hypothetical protein
MDPEKIIDAAALSLLLTVCPGVPKGSEVVQAYDYYRVLQEFHGRKRSVLSDNPNAGLFQKANCVPSAL